MSTITAPEDLFKSHSTSYEADPKHDLLWVITLYYNGIPIKHGETVYQIGRHKPPELQDLLGCSDAEWEDKYKPVYDSLEQDGHFARPGGEPPTILRRKVPWAPSDTMLEFTGDLFGGHIKKMITEWTYNPRKGHRGDNFEKLTHRTMVGHILSWLDKYRWEYREYYDELEIPKVDAYGFHPHKDVCPIVFEAITDHNNDDMIVNKYEKFKGKPYYYTWVFENRKQAAKALATLYWNRKFKAANAPYTNPENYSIGRLNKEIKKVTAGEPTEKYGINSIETLTTIHNKLGSWTENTGIRDYDDKRMFGHPGTAIEPTTPTTKHHMATHGPLRFSEGATEPFTHFADE